MSLFRGNRKISSKYIYIYIFPSWTLSLSIYVNSCWYGMLFPASCWYVIFNFYGFCAFASSSGGIIDLKKSTGKNRKEWQKNLRLGDMNRSLINLAWSWLTCFTFNHFYGILSCLADLLIFAYALIKANNVIAPGSWCSLGIGPQFGGR